MRRLGLFCVCWAISGPVQQVCAVYISGARTTTSKRQLSTGQPRSREALSFLLYFPFSILFFSPKKEEKPMSLVQQSFTTVGGGGLWAGSRMMGGQARKKRRAMGYTLKETICWTIERERESRASGGLLTDLLALFHPLTRARFSLFPWLNSAWPFLSYYLWGPTKKLAARQQRNPI